jgi:hypothetical protein
MWINGLQVRPDSHHHVPENSEFADFINKVMREVPEELTLFRIHAAKLLQAPFPRPPVRPNGCFRGLPPKANS